MKTHYAGMDHICHVKPKPLFKESKWRLWGVGIFPWSQDATWEVLGMQKNKSKLGTVQF